MIEISQQLAQLCDKAPKQIKKEFYVGRNFVFQEKILCDKNKIGVKKAKLQKG